MKAKKSNGRKKKVWHVTDFRELFELPDDLRKDRPGPLTYTKSFVTLTAGSKEHDIKHFERIEELKTRQERHLLRSVFEDIKNWTGKKTLRHRGFLVTTAEQPANYEYIASQLKMNVDELKHAMPILEEIGLIERVSMSSFQDNKPTKKAKSKSKSKAKKTSGRKKQKIKSGGKESTPDTSGYIRTNPVAAGTNRTALYNGKEKRKVNFKKKAKDKGNDDGKLKEEKNSRQTHRRNSHEIERKKSKDKPATNEGPTIVPRDSATGGRRVIGFPAPPQAAKKDIRNPEMVGDIAQGMLHRYSSDSKEFAGDIYEALGLPFDPRSVRGRREAGCFASVWMKAKTAGIDASALEELRVRAMQEAHKIARRKHKCRNVSAVFCTVFKRLLESKVA